MKITRWIKAKLQKWLGITELKKKILQDKVRNEKRFSTLFDRLNQLQLKNEQITRENDALMKQFNISADIHQYTDESWAVISVKGNPEYVRFVNLSNRDMREIHHFLKQFERTNRTIDSPIKFLKW